MEGFLDARFSQTQDHSLVKRAIGEAGFGSGAGEKPGGDHGGDRGKDKDGDDSGASGRMPGACANAVDRSSR